MFAGPHDYFKVVLDEFDGKKVSAWHFEDKDGNKTGNLAERGKGAHIDLVVGQQCRSTAHFFSRVYPALYREAVEKLNGSARP